MRLAAILLLLGGMPAVPIARGDRDAAAWLDALPPWPDLARFDITCEETRRSQPPDEPATNHHLLVEVSGTWRHSSPRPDRHEVKINLTRVAIALADSQRPNAPIHAEITSTSTTGHAELCRWLRPLIDRPFDYGIGRNGDRMIRGLDASQTAAGHIMPAPQLQTIHLLFTDAGFSTLWHEAFNPDLHARATTSADPAPATRFRWPVELPLVAYLQAEVDARRPSATQPDSAHARRIDYAGPIVPAPPPPEAPPPQLQVSVREGQLTGQWISATDAFAIEHRNRRTLVLDLRLIPPVGDPIAGMTLRQTRELTATAQVRP